MAGYVLIVESNADLQRRIGAALREVGFKAAAETEVAWAERSIAARQPDVVVIDTRLSDGDDFRLAEELRRDPRRGPPGSCSSAAPPRRRPPCRGPSRFAPADYL